MKGVEEQNNRKENTLMAIVSMKALLETGVHFGHRTRRWNPKMKPYIFTERNGIHILDLQQTIVLIEEAYNAIRDVVSTGGDVLFVGTKRQAQDTVAREAARANQPYVNDRWLGGTLTNWRTIRQRINYLRELETRRDAGEFDLLKKTERLRIEREIEKLNLRLGGIREMRDLPKLLFIVDVSHEETAIREANTLKIPIVGVVDTNSDPDPIDYVIPSNDDAIRAIKLIVGKMADAALEGIAMRKETMQEQVTDFDRYRYESFDGMEDAEDELLLGASTLAKLREAQPAGVVEVEEEKPIAAIENEVFFAEGDDESDAAAA
ncbi:30S ribosomal protein S2 [Candidatus Promineifilum breve]|uniref:Small ribosomal subunit protein uS2 n=1 Tax=Candidatus Promineifilum breve TaxID=1806508 RepID=A0A160T334_9CHLR|nr:30S ribosomal protein S2 [Candidatus Promineifilum breve]CUS03015.2 30S ribosomal protein S2 [Candidatus Promineifilum breve]